MLAPLPSFANVFAMSYTHVGSTSFYLRCSNVGSQTNIQRMAAILNFENTESFKFHFWWGALIPRKYLIESVIRMPFVSIFHVLFSCYWTFLVNKLFNICQLSDVKLTSVF